jgi:hypothetical protein
VCRFYKGALFNVPHPSLLPASVFGTQMQSTTALNAAAIVSDTIGHWGGEFKGDKEHREKN